MRLPPGVDDASSPGVERLATLEVASVLAPGVRSADLLREAYLQGWDADAAQRPGVFDPQVATHESGLSAEVAADGALLVRWGTTPRWDRFRFAPERSRRLRGACARLRPSADDLWLASSRNKRSTPSARAFAPFNRASTSAERRENADALPASCSRGLASRTHPLDSAPRKPIMTMRAFTAR